MKVTRSTVFCTESYEGIHRYEEAPETVAFLRVPHRHIFNVHVELEVFHDDREVEFIMLKRLVREWLQSKMDNAGVWNMEKLSCEQVAEMLATHLSSLYTGTRQFKIAVDEDGENGAAVEGTL